RRPSTIPCADDAGFLNSSTRRSEVRDFRQARPLAGTYDRIHISSVPCSDAPIDSDLVDPAGSQLLERCITTATSRLHPRSSMTAPADNGRGWLRLVTAQIGALNP